MRTTLTINDELLAEAKRLAAEKRTNLSAIVNDALRRALKRSGKKSETERFEMPTYGGKGIAPALSPAEMARIVEAEELEPFRPS